MLNTYFNVNRYIRTEEEFIKNKVPWAGHSMVWLGGGCMCGVERYLPMNVMYTLEHTSETGIVTHS